MCMYWGADDDEGMISVEEIASKPIEIAWWGWLLICAVLGSILWGTYVAGRRAWHQRKFHERR